VNLLGTSIDSNAKHNKEDILESAVTALCTLTHTKYEFLGLIAKLVKQTIENQQVIDLLDYQKKRMVTLDYRQMYIWIQEEMLYVTLKASPNKIPHIEALILGCELKSEQSQFEFVYLPDISSGLFLF
jgi:hypothetical protein